MTNRQEVMFSKQEVMSSKQETSGELGKWQQVNKQDIIRKVTAVNLREYGAYNSPVMEIWERALGRVDIEKGRHKVIAALNNNDTEQVLLELLRSQPEKVLVGLQLAATVLETTEMALYLPEKEQTLYEKLEALAVAYQIQIVRNDFVDLRAHDTCIIHHIETMLVLSELVFEDATPGTYVAIHQHNQLGPLMKVPFGTTVSELISVKPEDIKGIEIGSKLYDATAVNLVLDPTISLGNGVIRLLDLHTCVIDEAEKRLLTTRQLGCGQCTFCREGILQLHTMVKDITKGKGKTDQLSLMKEIGEAIGVSTLCSIGHHGATFLLDSMTHFPSEYEDHLKKKKCATGKCAAFVPLYIDPEACTGCEDCLDVCPVNCIEGKSGYIHMIDELDCTKCGKCIEICESNAIKTAAGKLPKLPDRLTKCGRFKKH